MLRSVFKTLSAGENTLVFKAGAKRMWLIGVNVEETDSSLAPVNSDTASMWIQDPKAENSLSLCHGLLVNGQLAGHGCWPIDYGNEIICKLYHSTAGNIAKVNLEFIEIEEAIVLHRQGFRGPQTKEPGPILTPHWSVRPPGSATFHAGKVKMLNEEGAAAGTEVTARPAAGMLWRVMMLWCGHDDNGNNPTILMAVTDGVTDMELKITGASNNATPQPFPHFQLNNPGMYMDGLVLSRDVYVKATYSVMGAGKKPHIRGVVMEYAE